MKEKNSDGTIIHDRANSLFICYTPFHLALVISYLKSETNNYVTPSAIYIGPNNAQSTNYCSLLSAYATVACLNAEGSRVKTVARLLRYLLTINRKSIHSIFCANYKLIYTRIALLFFNKHCELLKFDDGIGDILEKSWFTTHEHPLSRFFFKAIRPSLEYSRLKDLPYGFSIYETKASPGVRHISLLRQRDGNLARSINALPRITIVLGQTYSQNFNLMGPQEEQELVSSAIIKFKADIFIPHPLSRLSLGDLDVKVVKPDVIAEEYILDLLSKNRCHVIGFRTTVLFNLHKMCPSLITQRSLQLTNLTVYRYGVPLDETWIDDVWAENFAHVPFHLN